MMKHQPKHSPRPRTPRTPRIAQHRRSREQTEFIRSKIQLANEACQSGEFTIAVKLFSEIIFLEPNNSILYCNRSAAYIRMQDYDLALTDALKTIELDPEWHKGYYRQAIALQCMGRHPQALAAYASALAHDEQSQQLLQALVEAALKSNLQATLEPLFQQLDDLDINGKSFATVALIGQELLSSNEVQPAITVLESALHLGTEDLTLKGSVYSALSSAYWKCGNTKRALHYMHQDLLIVEGLKDDAGICRVHGNLGSAYYSQNSHDEALQHHKMQLEIASKMKARNQAAQALAALGHVYVSMSDYENALASHKRCASLRKQLNDPSGEARELGNVGTVYALMGDFENSAQYQEENVKLTKTLNNPLEICRALGNLGSLYHNIRKYDLAVKSFQEMFKLSQDIADAESQCKALAGLGNSFRMQNNLSASERCHEQQLRIAIDIKDRVMESRAQSNLGVTYQQKGDYEKALEFHKAHLSSCRKLSDKEGEGRAYGNIGNAFQSLGQYERAIKYHKLGLSIVRDLNDQIAEATLHGNIAVAFQSLQMLDEAMRHYEDHLQIAKQMDDLRSECIAESNLGNFYSTMEKFDEASMHFENHLTIATKLGDKSEMCKSSHSLAFSYYKQKNYNESIENYEQSISLAYDLNDQETLQLSYCNLGLAYLAMNDYEKAVRCQKLFLASAREKKNILSICKALGNLGNIYIQMGDTEEGLDFLYEQVRTADSSKLTYLQADCYHELAKTLESENKIDEAILRYEKELALRREIKSDLQPYYQSLTMYANMLESMGKFNEAYRCYCEMFQLTKRHGDIRQCRKTCALMGEVNIKMGNYDKAISAYRLQLECVDDCIEDSIEAGRIHVRISECFLHLNKIENAIQHLFTYQEIASSLKCYQDENDAYKRLSSIHKERGNYNEALMFSEKRLVCSQELSVSDICDSYKDVAWYHYTLENFDSSTTYYEQLLKTARDKNMTEYEYEAFNGLGDVYLSTKDFEKALHAYQNAMEKAEQLKDLKRKTLSCMRVGDASQHLDNKEEALKFYTKALEIAEVAHLQLLQVQVCGRLGKLNHLLIKREDSISNLRLAASYSESLDDSDDKVTAFYRLGLKLFFENEIEESKQWFEKVVNLIEECDGNSQTFTKPSVLQFVRASYQMLQKVLIMLQRPLEALFVAEKSNSIDLETLLKKTGVKASVIIPLYEKFQQRVQNVGTTACFYSIVVGQLYCWLLRPGQGFVKFWKHRIIEKYTDLNLPSLDLDDLVLYSFNDAFQTLHSQVEQLRNSLDVQLHEKELSGRSQSFAANIEILDRRQSRKSRIGRPVVTSTINNTSPYQFSYKNPAKTYHEIKASKNPNWYLDAPLEDLYKLLVSQTDAYFESLDEKTEDPIELTLVVPRELSLVPFTLLKGGKYDQYFHERYHLSYSPTLFWLLDHRFDKTNVETLDQADDESIFIFGGYESNSTEEATNIARIFGTSAVLGSSNQTARGDILYRLSTSNLCHLSTDVAWQTPSFVLPYKDITKDFSKDDFSDPDIENLDCDARIGSPSLTDIFMTVKDISEFQFQANLLTFGIAPYGGYSDPICADGLHLLITSLLMTGCKTILTSLWPVPDKARSYFLQNFYQLYNKGVSAYDACSQVVKLMQNSEDYQHPSNWSGFILYGQNSKLYRRTQSFTNALKEFLQNPNRDAIKVILHLVEKARQRLAQDRRSTLYVAEESIVKKIQSQNIGWRQILVALGFRFEKAQFNLPDAVFFPGHEYLDQLNTGSNTLYAFLGLSRNGLDAIAKLSFSLQIARPLTKLLQEVLHYFNQDMSNVQVPFDLKLWRTPGCHEFLSSLGFDVMGVGKTEVMLRSGKLNMRRPLQCALQAVKDLFESEEQSNEDPLINVNGKAYSEMKLNPNSAGHFLKKTISENGLNRDLNGTHSISKLNEWKEPPQILHGHKKTDNQYLSSELGLFGSKESNMMSETIGGSARRLRSKTNEEGDKQVQKKLSLYGLKPDMKDMKRYGTMDKLDVSDIIMNEGASDIDSDDENIRPIRFHDDYMPALRSPDVLNDEDIEHFSKYFKNFSLARRSLSRSFSNASSSSATEKIATKDKLRGTKSNGTDSFTDSYLTQNKEMLRRECSSSSDDSTSKSSTSTRRSCTESAEDVFTKEESHKTKMPPQWKKLHLSTDYFNDDTPIKTITIRDSLSIDSAYSSQNGKENLKDYAIIHSSNSSPKGSPETARDKKLLESSDEQESSKKKGWFKKFKNKKRHSLGNILDSTNLDSPNSEKNEKTKHHSSGELMTPNWNENKKLHRKSEGDINYNIRIPLDQTSNTKDLIRNGNYLSPNGVQMSLC